MKSFKARGIVLKETFVGESDKILTLLLKDFGKLSVSARGARKPNSKFLAGSQPFTYSDFVIYDGKRFYIMSQIDIIESFYGLRSDYDKLCYGNYFLELCDKTILASEECNDTLLLLLKALSAMSKGRIAPELAARIFEFKFLQLSGYGLETSACSVCGNSLEAAAFFYAEGCICQNCKRESPQAIPVSAVLLHTLDYILGSENPFSFKAGPELMEELKSVSTLFMASHLDVTIKSRELFP